jgi:hypothetical protein
VLAFGMLIKREAFVGQIVNAIANNSYLLLAVLFLSSSNVGTILVFNSAYIVLLSILRFSYSSNQFLASLPYFNLKKLLYVGIASLFSSLVVTICALLVDLQLNFIFVFVSIAFSFFWEIIRIDLFALKFDRLVLNLDCVYLLLNVCTLVFVLQQDYMNNLLLFDAWCMSNLVFGVFALVFFSIRFKSKDTASDFRKDKGNLGALALIALMTHLCNFFVNYIWSKNGSLGLVGDVRGLSVFYLPINFIIGILPIVLLRDQSSFFDSKKSRLLICGALLTLWVISFASEVLMDGFNLDQAIVLSIYPLIYFVLFKNAISTYQLIRHSKVQELLRARLIWVILFVVITLIVSEQRPSTVDFVFTILLMENLYALQQRQMRRKILHR